MNKPGLACWQVQDHVGPIGPITPVTPADREPTPRRMKETILSHSAAPSPNCQLTAEARVSPAEVSQAWPRISNAPSWHSSRGRDVPYIVALQGRGPGPELTRMALCMNRPVQTSRQLWKESAIPTIPAL